MSSKAKAQARHADLTYAQPAPQDKANPAWTIDERVVRMQALARQINGYIEYMCQTAGLGNTSAAATQRAVTAFHEQLIAVERQLRHIHDEFRLE